MRNISIYTSFISVFAVLFSLVSFASFEKFSAEVYENFHAGKVIPSNLREYIEEQDYKAALRIVEETLLPLDLSTANPQHVASVIEEAGKILGSHSDVSQIDEEPSWMQWLVSAFNHYDSLEDFERSEKSRCRLQTDDFKRFAGAAVKHLQHAKADALRKPMARIWRETKSEVSDGKDLFELSETDFGAVLILNGLVCVKLSEASENSSSGLRNKNGIWVWSPEYSGVGMHENRIPKLRDNLGLNFDEFWRQHEEAAEKNRAWTYPGVVSYIPEFKNVKRSLLWFIEDLQRQLKTTSKREAAAFAHQRFVQQHFLKDGNGRMGRILANVILKQAGFKPLIVTNDLCYTKATEEGFKDLQRFVDFIDNPACEAMGRTEL